ncbi:MAG TPA: ATP-binding domain-containing protein [Gaiellaceae bacterium]|nr:ATP-binding domain-containing protein [Gaiellaceae bacterium]
MAHPELQSEQDYVDRAYAHLERMRAVVAHAGDKADGEVAQAALDAWAARRLQTFEDAERGLCFGRLDFDDVSRPLYVGRRWVHDEEQKQVVVNWQAPAARPFYTATPHDPQRVTLRRRFRTDGRRVLDLADETFDGSTLDGAAVGDFLLDELERSRESRMRDIVATIQGDQYRLITREPDRPLVIQGGPGTGKTAVGLHRASWLLYSYREGLARTGVLVVGPNRTFMEYVSHVLPALGESAVEQRAVGELVDGVVPELQDPPEVARLKADPRLAEVLARAAELRLRSEPQELVARLEGSFVWVRERDVAELVEEARAALGTTTAARERFRMSLLRRFYEEYGRVLGGAAVRNFDEVENALRASGYLDSVLKAAWPAVAPDKLVRSLFSSSKTLADAADGILDAREQRLLRRRGPGWSDGDVPLLDEAHALVGSPPRAFGHVIVDEAQDLTPMQLRMIARRARDGALTILGDVAQGTGPVAYRRWEDVLPHLPHGDVAAVEELRHAYRVPREIMDVALPLLDEIAPHVEPPVAYRTGAAPPTIRRVGEEHLLAEAYREAARLGREAGLLALIVPDELIEAAVTGDLYDGVPVLTPRQSKGLEFDHVIVVEPALVAEKEQGLRELYVALTRPTKTLVVVHARPLPRALEVGARSSRA